MAFNATGLHRILSFVIFWLKVLIVDKVFIKNLRIRTIIGILDQERETPQAILVNVTVFTDPHPPQTPDDISFCVDYSDLAGKIRALVGMARRFTVEALAEDIARLCLSIPGVRKALVRVEKPGAIPEAESVGIEIQRS
jgi:FolB domain-containing protein